MLETLDKVSLLDEVSTTNVQNWAVTLTLLASNIDELHDDAAERLLGVTNRAIAAAEQVKVPLETTLSLVSGNAC